MKRILMGVAYLLASAILASSGVIGFSINSKNNDWTFLAFVIAGFFFFAAICYFATSEIKEIEKIKKTELLGDEKKDNKKETDKDDED